MDIKMKKLMYVSLSNIFLLLNRLVGLAGLIVIYKYLDINEGGYLKRIGIGILYVVLISELNLNIGSKSFKIGILPNILPFKALSNYCLEKSTNLTNGKDEREFYKSDILLKADFRFVFTLAILDIILFVVATIIMFTPINFMYVIWVAIASIGLLLILSLNNCLSILVYKDFNNDKAPI